jgi:hypothetical protein
VLDLSCRERREEFGKEVESSIAVAEDRHDLCGPLSLLAATFQAIPIRSRQFLFD